LLASIICHAQNWAELYNQSVEAYNNFEYEDARAYAEQALSDIKQNQSNPDKNFAVILRQLSLVCYDLEDNTAAVSYAKEEIETLIKIGGNQDMNFAAALQNLAVIRMYRSEYGVAEPLLREAQNIVLTYNTSESYEVGIANGNLAVALFQLEQDEEAGTLFQKSYDVINTYDEVDGDYYNIIYNYGSFLLERSELTLALKHFTEVEEYYNFETPNFQYGSILVKLADVLDQLGRFPEALGKYQIAVENFTALGEENSDEYAIALNNQSIDLQKTGKYDDATAIIEKLIVQSEATKSNDPVRYANVLTNYANLLIRKGESELAKTKLDEVVELYESTSITKDLTFVNALESLSGILLGNGDISGANDKIDQAISISQERNFSQKKYALYNQKAKNLAAEAKYNESKVIAQNALSEANTLFGPDALQTAFVKNTLAGIYTQLGEYEKSSGLYLEVLPVFERSYGSSHPEYATVSANYSSLLQLQGNYFTAEYYLKIAEEIKRNSFGTENRDYLTTYENLALLYLNTARYTDAALILTDIKSIKEKILPQNDPSLAYTLSNLGSVKKQLAEYGEAEQYLKKAKDIYADTYGTSHVYYALVINNLALLYQKMGNLDAAKPLFENALKIYEAQIGKLNPDYATALENLATLYQLEEDYDRAKELLEEVLAIDEQILGVNHPLYAKTLHNLASIYKENEEFDRAKELYQKALDIDKAIFGSNHPSYASTLYNLAALEQELENYDQALAYFEQVVEIRRNILGENHPDFAFSLYGLAAIKHKTGDFEGAKPIYVEVVSRYLENIQKYFPALSESEKSALFAKIKPVFDSYMDYAVDYNLLQKGTPEDREEILGSMYNLQLSTKALLLNASNKVRNRILASGDQELVDFFNEWTSLKEGIVKAYAMSREETERSGINIASMETQSNDLEKKLSLKSTAFAGEFDQETPTWQAVQSKLGPNDAAIELIRIKKKMKIDSVLYTALILEPSYTAPKLVVNPRGLEMEDKGFKTYKNLIIYKLQDTKSYAIFWKEQDEAISDNVETLYLSADGVLNKVNIATLYNPETKDYMVDRYKIRLLSNTRELLEEKTPSEGTNAEMFGFPAFNLGTQPVNEGGALFSADDMKSSFGNKIFPLPGTLEEVNNINAILQGGSWVSNVHQARRATEADLKALKSPKILHIATHGFFLEDLKMDKEDGGLTSRNGKFNPLLRSGLLFAGAENTINFQDIPGEEDGILTAYEAMNLNLDGTDLVVMSACETGLGEVKNGEGVYGLQRSFLVAGADNLIMSLWKVNDATTQMLMSSFYKNWFGGKTSLDAFNAAIGEVRSQFSEPYYWGAFVMLGK
ncbi:MAG: CHAT domain-containing protein/tetratricopeptide (TPR) repeat protein, partial [Marinoscillum sp.]